MAINARTKVKIIRKIEREQEVQSVRVHDATCNETHEAILRLVLSYIFTITVYHFILASTSSTSTSIEKDILVLFDFVYFRNPCVYLSLN